VDSTIGSRRSVEASVHHRSRPLRRPTPDSIADVDALLAADAIRFANHLNAWVEVDGGRIVDAAGRTRLRVDPFGVTFAALALPTRQAPPERHNDHVRFTQRPAATPARSRTEYDERRTRASQHGWRGRRSK
jgi:hypothetical protein